MEELIRFLTEYTEMFEKMEQKQVEKLGLLMTKELDKIEESIMMQQAMDKQLQNMEQRRQELFAKAGLNGKTLQEVAELWGRGTETADRLIQASGWGYRKYPFLQ